MDESFIFNAPEQVKLLPLFDAIAQNDLPIFKTILASYQPLTVEFTPLKYALQIGNVAFARYLLNDAQYNSLFITVSRPLYSHYFFALKSGNAELVELVQNSKFCDEIDCWGRGLNELARDLHYQKRPETFVENQRELLFKKSSADVKQQFM